MAASESRRRNVGQQPPSSGESNRQKKKKGASRDSSSQKKGLACLVAVGVLGLLFYAVFLLTRQGESVPDPDSILGSLHEDGAVLNCEEATFELPDGRRQLGLRASRDLQPGDTAVLAPLTRALHLGSIDERVRAACKAANCHQTALLILGLIVEAQAPRPEFAAYIRSLPRTFSNLMYFKPEQMKVLDMRSPRPYSEAVAKVITTTMQAVELLPPGMPPITEADVRWAFAIVQTRAYGITIAGQATQALLPGVDLANHAPLAEFNILAPKCEGMSCRILVLRPVKRGEQLNGNYGEYSNVDLLAQYDFVVPRNDLGPRLDSMPIMPVWMLKEGKAVNCATKAQTSGPVVRRKDGADGKEGAVRQGYVNDADLRCLFISEAFGSVEETKTSFGAVPTLAEDCLQAETADKCVGGPNGSEGVEYIEAAGRAHYAVKEACFQIALRFQNLTEALTDMGTKLNDDISEKLALSVGEEVRMVIGCMTHHGDRFERLADLARVKEFGE